MTIFHLLDSVAQDYKIEQETETTREIRPLPDEYDEEDDEFETKRPTGASSKFNSYSRLRMAIYLFGMTADKKPVRCTVEGFEPFFYVRMPGEKRSPRVERDFKRLLREVVDKKSPSLANMYDLTFEERKVLFGYSGDRLFPFAKLSVKSLAAFRSLKKLFLDDQNRFTFELYVGDEPLEVFEANLDPMLRFFHIQDLKPCGWVEVDADLDGKEMECEWTQVKPCNDPPMASAPFLMLAWDIECYSENGEFPVATRTWDRTSKQLFQFADDTDQAHGLLLQAMETPDSPPKGMDALRKHDGTKFAAQTQLRKAMDDLREDLDRLLSNKHDLSQEIRADRCITIRNLLKQRMRSVIRLGGDPIIQIGCVLVEGSAVKEKHIFVVGSCDDVPGAVVHSYETEKHMLIGWAKATAVWNPDILMGYNVFGFDEKYLWERSVELGVTTWENNGDRVVPGGRLQPLSRLADLDRPVKLEEKMLSSSAMGDNRLYIWSCFGRLQIDLYHYIKRNFALPFYKLDYVCQHFMSGKLSGVKTDFIDGTWQLKTKSTADVVVGRYLVLLDETGDVVVDKLKIVGIGEGTLIVEAPTGDDLEDLVDATADAVKWAIVKDDVSPQDIFRLHNGGGAEGRAKVAAYCIQDCDLTVELFKKLDVFNNAMAMANTCSVPISYIFVRGQGIKIESLIFKDCYARSQSIIVKETQPRKPVVSGTVELVEEGGAAASEESYEGAIVLTPNPGFYLKSPIGVADFASLYPSTIISENISYDTLAWVKDYDLQGNLVSIHDGSEENEEYADESTRWTDIVFDIWGAKEGDKRKVPAKERKGYRVCRYAQGKRGTLPDIVAKLLAARKAKRKEAEKEQDPFKKALLDAEQLAYKLTANSLYGQLGSGTFKIRLQHLAASVTAYGRKQIMFAKAAIETFYGPGAIEKAVEPGTWSYTEDVHSLNKEEETYIASLGARGQALHTLAQKKLASSYFVNQTLGFAAWKKAGCPTAAATAAEQQDCKAEIVYGDTDSLFVNFNVPQQGKEAIEATMHLTEEAGKLVTTCLKSPHDFEYDKTFYPFIIFSKKRYVGNKYEESPEHYSQNSMGIATKRRDYAGIVKVIYGGAIRILLTQKNPHAAVDFVKEKLQELAEGKTSMTQLLLTKSLRSEYKSKTPPAHKILADRIAARDPGNAPASGERISFVYIIPPQANSAEASQSDRVETPGFMKAKGLKPDAKYYMEHQLMNPLGQLFGLIAEQLPGCAPPKEGWDAVTPEYRESAAIDFLFREALEICERAAVRRGAERMGFTVQTRSMAATAAATTPTSSTKPTQQQQASATPPVVVKTTQLTLERMFFREKGQEEANKKRKATLEKKAKA